MEQQFDERSNKWWIQKILAYEDEKDDKGEGTQLFEFAEEIFELKPFIFDKAPDAREKHVSRIFKRLSASVHPDKNPDWVEPATQAMSILSEFHEMIAKEVAIENMTWDEFKKSDGGERTGAEDVLRRAKETQDEEGQLEMQFADDVMMLAKRGQRVLLKGLKDDHYIWNGVAVEIMDCQKSPLRFKGRLPGGQQTVIGYGRITRACFQHKGDEPEYLDWQGRINPSIQTDSFWEHSSSVNTVHAPNHYPVAGHDFSMLQMQKARSAATDPTEFNRVLLSGYFLDLTQQGKDVLVLPYRRRMRVRSKHALPRGPSSYWYVAVVELDFPTEDYFISLAGNLDGEYIEPIKQEMQKAASKLVAVKDQEAKKLLKDSENSCTNSRATAASERREEGKHSAANQTIATRPKGLDIIPLAKPIPRRFPEGAWFRFREKPNWLSLRVWPQSGILRGKIQEYRRFPHLSEDTAFVQLYDEKDNRLDGGQPEQITVSRLEELGGAVEHSMQDNEREAEKARAARRGMLTGKSGYAPAFPPTAANPEAVQEQVDTLKAIVAGASEEHARKVLKQANGNLELAANYLMADKKLL